MSNLVKHAQAEFKAADWLDEECEMQQMMMDNLIQLLQVFGEQGHSGFSAPYCLNAFNKLARFEPLTPLTGEESEWNEVGENTYQNNRCGEVFKEGKDGKPYWIHGKIFKDKDGCTYTNSESRVFIEFPWTRPEPEIIEVDE